MFQNNRSTDASISFEIILSPEVIHEYFNGLTKVEAAKNGMSIPPVKAIINPKTNVHLKPKEKSELIQSEEDGTKQTTIDDDELKEMFTQLSNAALDMECDTKEEKDEMERILPGLFEVAKSMQHRINSDECARQEINTSGPELTTYNKEDEDMKDMLIQLVDEAIQTDTQEEKDDIKRFIPGIIDIAMSMSKYKL